jgi:C_GCAxxG_C_C family probable redox protein
MDPVAEAVGLFGPNLSCAQAVLASFAGRLGLSRADALRLGRGLGMGMAQGLTCGAVSAAILALGLAEGPASPDDREPRFRCYDRVEEFSEEFRQRHGSIACRDLIGVDLGTAEGRKRAQEGGLFARICPVMVKSAAEILQEMLPAPAGEEGQGR